MRIYLIGFMGAGKTTVGKHLSKSLDLEHIDLDEFIEEKEGMSISKIFELKGEAYFRQIEYNALKTLIIDYDDLVLSLGGGAPCYLDTIKILRFSGTPVYLKVKNEILVYRLKHDKTQRPLLKGMSEQELKQYVHDTIERRSVQYELAKLTVDGSVEISQIVEDIRQHL